MITTAPDREGVRGYMAEQLSVPVRELTEDTSLSSSLNNIANPFAPKSDFDSLDVMSLLIELEEHYNLPQTRGELTTVGRLIDYVVEHNDQGP